MVCKVNSLNHDDVALVEEHISDREGGHNFLLFNCFRDEWTQAVQNYVEHKGNPEHVQPVGIGKGRLKTALHNLWDHPKGMSKIIKNELQSHKLSYCPFCGEMGHPETHDHYLPKAIFAEFSIAHLNLVPMCDACQKKKGTDYLIDGRKGFLHPYFDADEVTVNLSIDSDFEPVPIFDFELDCPDELRGILETHIDHLDIKKRFFKHLSVFYTGIVDGITTGCAHADDIRQSIQLLLTMNKATYEALNRNHWDAVIYRSLLNSDEWLDHMVEKCIAARL
ncbi:hypothetical protein ACR42D_15055 [Desulfovibrio caledoniensis]